MRPEGRGRSGLYTASAAFSLSAGIAGWLFVLPSWGFASLAGPFGLVAAIPGLWSQRKGIAVLGLLLNALLTVLLVAWWKGLGS